MSRNDHSDGSCWIRLRPCKARYGGDDGSSRCQTQKLTAAKSHGVHSVNCLRLISKRKVEREVRRFPTTTQGLLALAEWLESAGCTHVAMEATGVYWKPAWHILRWQRICRQPAAPRRQHHGIHQH